MDCVVAYMRLSEWILLTLTVGAVVLIYLRYLYAKIFYNERPMQESSYIYRKLMEKLEKHEVKEGE